MHKLRTVYESIVDESASYEYKKNEFCDEDMEFYITGKLKKSRNWYRMFRNWLYKKAKAESWITSGGYTEIEWLKSYINDVATEIESERIGKLAHQLKTGKITWDKWNQEMKELVEDGKGYITALETVLYDLTKEFEEQIAVSKIITKGSEEAGVNLDI